MTNLLLRLLTIVFVLATTLNLGLASADNMTPCNSRFTPTLMPIEPVGTDAGFYGDISRNDFCVDLTDNPVLLTGANAGLGWNDPKPDNNGRTIRNPRACSSVRVLEVYNPGNVPICYTAFYEFGAEVGSPPPNQDHYWDFIPYAGVDFTSGGEVGAIVRTGEICTYRGPLGSSCSDFLLSVDIADGDLPRPVANFPDHTGIVIFGDGTRNTVTVTYRTGTGQPNVLSFGPGCTPIYVGTSNPC